MLMIGIVAEVGAWMMVTREVLVVVLVPLPEVVVVLRPMVKNFFCCNR